MHLAARPSTLRRRRNALLFVGTLCLCSLAATTNVLAADPPGHDLGRARDAYDRGVRAHNAGDFATAAKAFGEADALAPTAASLEAALEAAMRADDAALGAELLERSDARPYPDGSLLKSIEAARKRFANRTGTIRVECGGAARCLVSVDGRASDASRPVIATVGPHSVVVERGTSRFERLIEVAPNKVTVVGGPDAPTIDVQPASSTSHSPSSQTSRSGPVRTVSPVWFFVGTAVTLGFAAGATITGLMAKSDHDDFIRAGCSPQSSSATKPANCDSLSDSGSRLTLVTNAFIVVGGLFAIQTAVLGGFYVNWSGSSSGGTASIGGRFK